MNSKDAYQNPRSGYLFVGILGALAVALGAFGAHGLKGQVELGTVTGDQLAGFDTGVRYQMYHTLAMLAVLILTNSAPSKILYRANYFFLAGIILFSGSLYLLCTRGITGFEGLRILGPVTPIGGLCFVIGWILLGWGAYKKS